MIFLSPPSSEVHCHEMKLFNLEITIPRGIIDEVCLDCVERSFVSLIEHPLHYTVLNDEVTPTRHEWRVEFDLTSYVISTVIGVENDHRSPSSGQSLDAVNYACTGRVTK